MSELELPNLLVSEVKAGNVVLVLGAGASVPAMLASGVNPPITGARLAKLIAEKFLGDKYTKFSLTQVAELAISEAGLFPVQDFVASLLEPVRPTPVHTTLASFRWKGLATTNYDRLLEHAYAAASASPQSLVPFIDNTDRVEERTRAPNSLLFLKLHGCISRTHNTDCPLLLSTDQFLEFKRGRSRLFGILKEWASECPLLFVGYGLQDSNIRLIIDELTQELPARPRYYLVLPDIEDIEKRYWENRKITAIKGNIESLVEQLDSSIGRTFRSLAPVHVDQPHPVVHSLLRPRVALSTNAVLFLDRDADCVNAITATEHMAPRLFYRGFSNSWSPIEQALDVPRQLTDTLTLDYVLEDTAAQGSASVQFVVIKAHAGAGKTVLMRRLAWNAAKEFKRLVLYIRADGVLDTGAIAEIVEKCDSPVLIFVDQALERRRELERLFSAANMPKGRMIVFCAVRTNEWNQAPDSLTSLATDEFELGYLSSKEIRGLLQLLKQHSALGNLTALNEEQRMERLVERAGRQLLVALHEATLGEQFERIVRDEYYGITPHAAQSIYLSVCLLNQFGVSVRAGVISRLFGVPFESFKEQFLGPLEEIIIVEHDSTTGDYRYAARHPHIAEMVVRSVLSRHELLFNEVVRCVRVLNPSYSSDRTALQRLLQGRAVLDSFPDPQMAQQLYQAAEQSSGKDPFLLQQQCIYEMKRPNGDLQRAGKLLDQAMSLAKHSTTILHTLSELKIRQAELSALPLERRKLVREALEICNTLRRREPSAYVYYTIVKAHVLRIRDAIATDDSSDQSLESAIREAENYLKEGQERYPANSYLRTAEAELALVLSESQRALQALKKAFELNNRNSYIAMRICDWHVRNGSTELGLEVLKLALAAKPIDQALNGYYARLLIDRGSTDSAEILYHLQRAFTSGDENYESQFLYARQLYIAGRAAESSDLFRELKRAKLPPWEKRRIRYPLEERTRGRIVRIEAGYCIVERDGSGESILAPRDEVARSAWDEIAAGRPVVFSIGFSMYGPTAYKVELVR